MLIYKGLFSLIDDVLYPLIFAFFFFLERGEQVGGGAEEEADSLNI